MKFKFASVLALAFAASTMAHAADTDLVLPNAKWFGEFEGYVCDDSQTGFVPRPQLFNEMNVNFGKMYSDSTLDNVLLTATFEENGAQCNYSVIFLADNAAKTAKLVESRAYSTTAGATCEAGKKALDEKLIDFGYLYYGKPHRVAIQMPFEDAADLCDAGAVTVAPSFVVKGRLQQ